MPLVSFSMFSGNGTIALKTLLYLVKNRCRNQDIYMIQVLHPVHNRSHSKSFPERIRSLQRNRNTNETEDSSRNLNGWSLPESKVVFNVKTEPAGSSGKLLGPDQLYLQTLAQEGHGSGNMTLNGKQRSSAAFLNMGSLNPASSPLSRSHGDFGRRSCRSIRPWWQMKNEMYKVSLPDSLFFHSSYNSRRSCPLNNGAKRNNTAHWAGDVSKWSENYRRSRNEADICGLAWKREPLAHELEVVPRWKIRKMFMGGCSDLWKLFPVLYGQPEWHRNITTLL